MNRFCADIEARIGSDLRDIGAVKVKNVDAPEFDLCFFKASGRLFFISRKEHDGLNCYVAPAGVAHTLDYEQWESIWEVNGYLSAIDTEAEFNRYITSIPKDYAGFVTRIGEELKRLFRSSE